MTTNPSSARNSGAMLWIGVLVAVVVIGVVAVVLARGGGEELPPIEDETAAVTLVGGEALPVATTTEDPAVGMTIPTVKGTAVDGSEMTIGPDGTPKIIVFMAHWCPHCQREIPVLVEHFADAGLPEGVDVVGVSTRVDRDLPNYPPSDWLDDEGWTLPTLADSQDADAFGYFGVSGFPTFIAVDADGKVVTRLSGELPTEVFDALVEAARTGQVA